MRTREMIARITAGATGAALLVGGAGAAFADEVDYGSSDINVNVEIDEYPEPGVLALTVDGTTTTLAETGTAPDLREFTGALPTVTVTDTRVFPDRIDPAAFWYVVGSSSDFTGDDGQPDIPAGHFGWAPALAGGTDPGEVAAGDQVDTVMDTGPDAVGLVDQELLAIAAGSQEIHPTGSWSVDADLFLKTPISVEPGSYQAKITLSLFEFTG